MEYTSMRDYSRLRAVSYEAIRQQVSRYEKELSGHTKKDGKKILLDEWAVSFLDKHRMTRTVVVKADSDESEREIKKLQEDKDRLIAELDKAKSMIIGLQKENGALLADNARSEALLMIADKEHDELTEAKQRLNDSTQELIEISRNLAKSRDELAKKDDVISKKDDELSQYRPTWFGLYKKVKS